MLINKLKEKFGYDTPIFTDEILKLFSQYTRAYVFRKINEAEDEGSLARIDTGVYYLPQTTPFGKSVITASDVAKKKYIEDGNTIYGIYSGLTLQNAFSITTQTSNTLEIITNNESARRREVTIDGMTFILRKSRTKITSENADAYRVLQLFSENNGIEIDDAGKQYIADYIKNKKIEKATLFTLAKSFPAKTLKNLIYSEVI